MLTRCGCGWYEKSLSHGRGTRIPRTGEIFVNKEKLFESSHSGADGVASPSASLLPSKAAALGADITVITNTSTEGSRKNSFTFC